MVTEALGREAIVRLAQFKFEVVREGDFVRCSVTRKPIPLPELKYWNAEEGEVYLDAETAHSRWRERAGLGGGLS